MSKFNFVFLNKNQSRRFVLFLLAASFVWFLKNLNETYQKAVQFNLNLENSNQNKNIHVKPHFSHFDLQKRK